MAMPLVAPVMGLHDAEELQGKVSDAECACGCTVKLCVERAP